MKVGHRSEALCERDLSHPRSAIGDAIGYQRQAARSLRDVTALLRELAGVELSTKRVERSGETDGQALQASIAARAEAPAAGRRQRCGRRPRSTDCSAVDGIGLPTVPKRHVDGVVRGSVMGGAPGGNALKYATSSPGGGSGNHVRARWEGPGVLLERRSRDGAS